jgi:hypothetical protein
MIDKTITSIFMVPTLKVPKNELLDNKFINGYIKDVDNEIEYKNSIYLLFQPDDISKFREFLENEYERTKEIIEDYDYTGGFVVVVYQLNKKYANDYSLIKLGKYSKTSSSFQALFPKVIKIKKNGLHRDELSLQYRIFNKTRDLIEYWEKKIGISWDDNFELWEGWDEDKEILNINDVKQKII